MMGLSRSVHNREAIREQEGVPGPAPILIRRMVLGLAAILALWAVLGCDSRLMYAGIHTPHHLKGTYKKFNGKEDQAIKLKAGETVVFDYSSNVKEGSLSMVLQDSGGHTSMKLPTGGMGRMEWKTEQEGSYKLVVTGSHTSGSFDVSWETITP